MLSVYSLEGSAKFRVCYLLRRQYTSQYAIPLTFESRVVGIRLSKFFLKLSDFIPHKSHYVILHSSTDTDIKSDPLLNPTIILNFRLAIPPDKNLNLHNTFRTPTN